MSQKPKVIIAGGGGYIGSHAALRLLQQSEFEPIIVDNFTRGNRELARTLGCAVHEGDIGDSKFLDRIFSETKPCAVMHFAASAYVGESVTNPALYYRNNVAASMTLLDSMIKASVTRIIFSSTCATYGTPEKLPITEETPLSPISPYGFTKLVVERMIKDYEHAFGLRSVIFRYFNASGADPSGRIGERHDPETHLIPLAIYSALGKRELQVFGSDYPTSDGTCIRDYIHVNDIADAHVKGLQYLMKENHSEILNIGTGVGNSVLEVIQAVEAISKKSVKRNIVERRPGDPPVLVASAEKLKRTLKWTPAFTDLRKIVETAWAWHVKEMGASS